MMWLGKQLTFAAIILSILSLEMFHPVFGNDNYSWLPRALEKREELRNRLQFLKEQKPVNKENLEVYKKTWLTHLRPLFHIAFWPAVVISAFLFGPNLYFGIPEFIKHPDLRQIKYWFQLPPVPFILIAKAYGAVVLNALMISWLPYTIFEAWKAKRSYKIWNSSAPVNFRPHLLPYVGIGPDWMKYNLWLRDPNEFMDGLNDLHKFKEIRSSISERYANVFQNWAKSLEVRGKNGKIKRTKKPGIREREDERGIEQAYSEVLYDIDLLEADTIAVGLEHLDLICAHALEDLAQNDPGR